MNRNVAAQRVIYIQTGRLFVDEDKIGKAVSVGGSKWPCNKEILETNQTTWFSVVWRGVYDHCIAAKLLLNATEALTNKYDDQQLDVDGNEDKSRFYQVIDSLSLSDAMMSLFHEYYLNRRVYLFASSLAF